MALNPLIDLDLNTDQMVARVEELKPKGFRLLSLSMYGDPEGFRWCTKCRGLFFDGPGPKKKCPASATHQGFGTIYSLVKDSLYKEHQRDWRRCRKCAGLFFREKKRAYVLQREPTMAP